VALRLEPTEDPTDLQEAKIRSRTGRIIARVIGAFDWDESLHARHAAGTEVGGRFRKKGKQRGAARTSIFGTGDERRLAVNKSARREQMELKGRMEMSSPDKAMLSPPGGWTASM
jgi:hypothetical protein